MKYNTFRYDTGVLYDSGPFSSHNWLLQIDWDGDGVYSDENEATRMVSFNSTRGRRYLINSSRDGFEPVMVGSLNIQLDNDDGRYDPFNTSSPIYPYVRPGVNIQIKVRIPTTGNVYSVFTGQVEDIQPVSGGNPEKVRIVAVERSRYLKDQKVSIATQQDIGLDEAVGALLTASEWPWGSEIEASPDIIPWFWVEPDTGAYAAITELMNGSMGTFFIAADGTAKFYERNYTSEAIASIDQTQIKKEISFRQPWEVICNQVTIVSNPREEQAESDLWRLIDKPYIPIGGELEYWASFSYGGKVVPATNLIQPVANTDYQVNTAQDGSGVDLTADCSCVVDDFGKILLQNNSGENGFITLLKLRGTALTSLPTKIILSDPASKSIYGPKPFVIDTLFLQDSNWISEFGNVILAQLSTSQLFPSIQLENQAVQFELDLFDIVNLDFPKKNLLGDYRLAYISHQWLDDAGQQLHTELSFEPLFTLAVGGWRFPAEMGISTRFAL